MIYFRVSPTSAHGLGSALQAGKCSVSKHLALVGDKPGRWTLIDIRKEKLPPGCAIIKGMDLVKLMQAAANDGKKSLSGKQFQDLIGNPKFRNFCRMVPGMESKEHLESRTRSSQTMSRMYEAAKVVGKGLSKLAERHLEGRYVGQDQGSHNYWIREIVFRDTPKPIGEIDILIGGWNQDKSSKLSLKEWEAAKKEEWETSDTDKEFLPWIAANSWDAEVKAAWHDAHPGERIDEAKLKSWVKSQTDPVLYLQTWDLKKISGKKTETEFQEWRKNIIIDREENFKEFKEQTGVQNLSLFDHERLESEWSHSGSVDSSRRWMLQQLWKESGSRDDFPTYARKLLWESQIQVHKTDKSFEEWNTSEDATLHARHKGSHLPLTFEQYRKQQDDGILTEPAPFINLSPEERKVYETTCTDGKLIRNGHPLNTEFDKTLHSGSGYAIFVIGADDELYCGSHIGGVFHHSSFVADEATAGAGEIKTDKDGKVTELSSKSGHYRPTNAQNLYMLRYFKDRGVDLNIKFTYYDTAGKTQERNAQEYLDELERAS